MSRQPESPISTASTADGAITEKEANAIYDTHAAATKEVHREQVAVLQLNAKIEELETTLKDAKALREVTLERLDTKRRAASEAEDAFYNGVVRTKRAHLMVLSDRIPSYCPPDSPILRAQPFF
jgi:hypothetical protein